MLQIKYKLGLNYLKLSPELSKLFYYSPEPTLSTCCRPKVAK